MKPVKQVNWRHYACNRTEIPEPQLWKAWPLMALATLKAMVKLSLRHGIRYIFVLNLCLNHKYNCMVSVGFLSDSFQLFPTKSTSIYPKVRQHVPCPKQIADRFSHQSVHNYNETWSVEQEVLPPGVNMRL